MKIRAKDKVKVISGKDKGKVGEVLRVIQETNKLIVSGVNLVKKHVKGEKGGIVSFEKPVSVSSVMYYDEESSKPTKVGYSIVDGKKYRVLKSSGKVLK